MKEFNEKLYKLLVKEQKGLIEPIEWSQVNEELSDDETIITTKFKYKAPTPNKHKD
ncbi:TPA: hypothetical protein RJJ13_001470 [Staphylococcus pseudintermedius]|nr:hypothetical protein [Staphylococcus pseudintermedius]EJD5666120.1 hypothetical protein [Staphylococcus pseudintermedius]EJO7109497.1 hypothetical protein [Staphylococcus pseudintermedius]EKO8572546.1 hypothetical protein [Staphylococcus pseudintermedius]ELJ9326697.1 hypothetical protein [Staphylococcus pseudintermedius]